MRPVILYGSKCCSVQYKTEEKDECSGNEVLRWICEVTREDIIKNKGSVGMTTVADKIKENRLRCYVMRIDSSEAVRVAIFQYV